MREKEKGHTTHRNVQLPMLKPLANSEKVLTGKIMSDE